MFHNTRFTKNPSLGIDGLEERRGIGGQRARFQPLCYARTNPLRLRSPPRGKQSSLEKCGMFTYLPLKMELLIQYHLLSAFWYSKPIKYFSAPVMSWRNFNFSGVLTMAKVDSSFSQYSLLLFQDISKVDKKKHLPRWKSHLLGQTKDIQEKSVRFFITVVAIQISLNPGRNFTPCSLSFPSIT